MNEYAGKTSNAYVVSSAAFKIFEPPILLQQPLISNGDSDLISASDHRMCRIQSKL